MTNNHYYDAYGMNAGNASEWWNRINVPLASPIGIAVLNSQTHLLPIVKAGLKQNKIHFKGASRGD